MAGNLGLSRGDPREILVRDFSPPPPSPFIFLGFWHALQGSDYEMFKQYVLPVFLKEMVMPPFFCSPQIGHFF